MKTINDFEEYLDNLKRTTVNGSESPHKPLLLLYIVEKIENNPEIQEVLYIEEEKELKDFFKGNNASDNVHFPFGALRNDDKFEDYFGFEPKIEKSNPESSELKEKQAKIILKNDFKDLVKRDADAVIAAIKMEICDLKSLLRKYVAERKRSEILDSEEFFFEKTKNLFKKIKEFNHQDGESFYENLLEDHENKNKNGMKFDEYLAALKQDSNEYAFVELVCRFIAHIDYLGGNKKVWNEYDDKRTLAKTGVFQGNWINSLIKFKIFKNDYTKLTAKSVVNALSFLDFPEKNMTMLAERHRKMFAKNVLLKNYSEETFLNDFLDYFSEIEIPTKNQSNRTTYISYFLYEDAIEPYWKDIVNDESKKRAIVGLYLSKFGENLNSVRFPNLGWGDIYELFAPKLKRDNEEMSSFKNSIKNTRDSYDGYFSNSREGWKNPDGTPQNLSKALQEVYDDYGEYDEEELWKAAKRYLVNDTTRRYWRIGTTDGNTSYWDQMKTGAHVAIGWSDLGDLRNANIQTKQDVVNLLHAKNYKYKTSNKDSEKAGEILNFFKEIQIGDVVLAQSGESVLGIGIVDKAGNYQFDSSLAFSHKRNIVWKCFPNDFINNVGQRGDVKNLV